MSTQSVAVPANGRMTSIPRHLRKAYKLRRRVIAHLDAHTNQELVDLYYALRDYFNQTPLAMRQQVERLDYE
jgi:hypothetical protein